jgi:hypothetical protein
MYVFLYVAVVPLLLQPLTTTTMHTRAKAVQEKQAEQAPYALYPDQEWRKMVNENHPFESPEEVSIAVDEDVDDFDALNAEFVQIGEGEMQVQLSQDDAEAYYDSDDDEGSGLSAKGGGVRAKLQKTSGSMVRIGPAYERVNKILNLVSLQRKLTNPVMDLLTKGASEIPPEFDLSTGLNRGNPVSSLSPTAGSRSADRLYEAPVICCFPTLQLPHLCAPALRCPNCNKTDTRTLGVHKRARRIQGLTRNYFLIGSRHLCYTCKNHNPRLAPYTFMSYDARVLESLGEEARHLYPFELTANAGVHRDVMDELEAWAGGTAAGRTWSSGFHRDFVARHTSSSSSSTE